MAFESPYQLSSQRIPDLDSAICRGACQHRTARGKLYADRSHIVAEQLVLQLIIGQPTVAVHIAVRDTSLVATGGH